MLEIMDLKSLQAPLKARYREEPQAALITLRASGAIGDGVTCSVETGQALVKAGLHPATGGTAANICSGDMLLQALAACAGVTLKAVATALGINLKSGKAAKLKAKVVLPPDLTTEARTAAERFLKLAHQPDPRARET